MAQSGASNNKLGSLWREAALRGALEAEPDFKLKNSVEHYYTHEKNKFSAVRRGAARRCVAQSSAKRRFVARLKGNLILSLKTV